MRPFSERVREIVRSIPEGSTMTYRDVATRAGNPKAARAVGSIMRANYDEGVPCHRVIASDGTLRGYNRGGERRKREILRREGALNSGAHAVQSNQRRAAR